MRKPAVGALIGIGTAAVVLVSYIATRAAVGPAGQSPFDTVELKTYDWRLARTARAETARKDIALVEIDESSVRNLEPNAGRWPWPRVVHSMVVDFLARAPAKLIVYDIDFAEADSRVGFQFGGSTMSGPASDRELANSIRRAGNVLLIANATFDGRMAGVQPPPAEPYPVDVAGIYERQTIFAPTPVLAAAASGFGHNLFVYDSDGPIRHAVPFVRSHGRVFPLLGVEAALRVAGIAPREVNLDGTRLRLRDRVMPLTSRANLTSAGVERYLWGLIGYRGPAVLADLRSRTYPTYTFFDLLYSENQLLNDAKPTIDPSVFRDKIVFVGTSAYGLADTFETPFASGKMPGIQVHAAVADDILSNRFMWPASGAVRVATVVAASIFVGIVATTVPAWWAAAAMAVFSVVFAWIAERLFASGYWINLTQPLVASALALFGGVAYQYLVEGREKRKMKRLFGQYVSKDVYDQLVANPTLARLGGQRRQMTVLFSDIRGFTTVSERGRPEEIVQTLNEYFTRMVAIVFDHRGTVDKFVGDMVMALFGAPLDDPDHAEHAVEAALDMLAELHRLNARWKAEGRPELDIGIGISTGAMIAGNVGSEQIMSYTVIGDAVNLGARLESLNKQYGTRIIISDATRDRLKHPYLLRPLGDVVVKGKTQPVAIFEVVGRAQSAAAVQEHA